MKILIAFSYYQRVSIYSRNVEQYHLVKTRTQIDSVLQMLCTRHLLVESVVFMDIASSLFDGAKF